MTIVTHSIKALNFILTCHRIKVAFTQTAKDFIRLSSYFHFCYFFLFSEYLDSIMLKIITQIDYCLVHTCFIPKKNKN